MNVRHMNELTNTETIIMNCTKFLFKVCFICKNITGCLWLVLQNKTTYCKQLLSIIIMNHTKFVKYFFQKNPSFQNKSKFPLQFTPPSLNVNSTCHSEHLYVLPLHFTTMVVVLALRIFTLPSLLTLATDGFVLLNFTFPVAPFNFSRKLFP